VIVQAKKALSKVLPVLPMSNIPSGFDRRKWNLLNSSASETPGRSVRDQARRSSVGRPWKGLFVWHQIGPAGELYIPPQQSHCIVLRRSTPTTLIYRCGTSMDNAPWRPGDALVIPAEVPGYWHSADARDNVHIEIDHGWLLRASESNSHIRFDACRHDPVLASFANLLLSSLDSQTSMQPSFSEGIALAIAIHLLEHYSDSRSGGSDALTRRQVDLIVNAVSDSLSEKWPLLRLAELVGLSPFHFARCFKTTFGLPPHAYVSAKRMEVAAHLLRNTSKSIEQIANATGHTSSPHFSQAFRKHWGLTPTVYRREH
jgi:AraC family transcriptional regulator